MRLISYAVLLTVFAMLPFVLPLYVEQLNLPGEFGATGVPSVEMANLMRTIDLLPFAIAALIFVEGVIHIREKRIFGKEREAIRKQVASHSEVLAEVEALRAAASRVDEVTSELEQSRSQEADLTKALQALKRDFEGQKQKGESKGEVEAEVIALLSMLQKKGRLVDFLMDDITKYPDPQVGAAARIVHQGCASVLKDYFAIEPVHRGSEGSNVTVKDETELSRYRLLGKAEGAPPFNGRLVHGGWVTTKVTLPKVTHKSPQDSRVIAPAEVEL